MKRAVAYYRVSTAKQGDSGLGLEAQEKAVEEYCRKAGLTLTAPPFKEIESGRRNDRPELLKAIHRCRLTGATLVVAKMDRLTRNVSFLGTLRESKIAFAAADLADATNLTVNLLVSVAEAEREAASIRTKEALAAVKARGTWCKKDGTPYKSGNRLGNPNGAAALERAGRGYAKGTAVAQELAAKRAEDLREYITGLQADGCLSLGSIARRLNDDGMRTPRGATWHPSSVSNLLARLGA